MKLVAEKLGQREKHDLLRLVRDDGSACEIRMPRQGILPHDLVHFVVESQLAFRRAFLGMVDAGASPGFAMEAGNDAAGATEAVHAEAIVEALQAQLWSGALDAEAFLDGVRGACAARGVDAPGLASIAPGRLFARCLQLAGQWNRVPARQDMTLEFPEPTAGVTSLAGDRRDLQSDRAAGR